MQSRVYSPQQLQEWYKTMIPIKNYNVYYLKLLKWILRDIILWNNVVILLSMDHFTTSLPPYALLCTKLIPSSSHHFNFLLFSILRILTASQSACVVPHGEKSHCRSLRCSLTWHRAHKPTPDVMWSVGWAASYGWEQRERSSCTGERE